MVSNLIWFISANISICLKIDKFFVLVLCCLRIIIECTILFRQHCSFFISRSWTPKRASSECNLNKNARWDCLHYLTMLILYRAYDASSLTWATCSTEICNSIRHEVKKSFSQDLIESIYLIHCSEVCAHRERERETRTHT